MIYFHSVYFFSPTPYKTLNEFLQNGHHIELSQQVQQHLKYQAQRSTYRHLSRSFSKTFEHYFFPLSGIFLFSRNSPVFHCFSSPMTSLQTLNSSQMYYYSKLNSMTPQGSFILTLYQKIPILFSIAEFPGQTKSSFRI